MTTPPTPDDATTKETHHPRWLRLFTLDRFLPLVGLLGLANEALVHRGSERPYLIAAYLLLLGVLPVRTAERALTRIADASSPARDSDR